MKHNNKFKFRLVAVLSIIATFGSAVVDATTNEKQTNQDFRAAAGSKKAPKAAVDGVAGLVVAFADVAGTPEQAFRALTTNETEKWWKLPDTYHLKDWTSDLRSGGKWGVTVEITGGKIVHEWGEYCSVDAPREFVKTKRMDANPFVGDRETTVTFRFEPSPAGTLVTVREEGFIGRAEAAYGTAENWEKVLGWLDSYLGAKKADKSEIGASNN